MAETPLPPPPTPPLPAPEPLPPPSPSRQTDPPNPLSDHSDPLTHCHECRHPASRHDQQLGTGYKIVVRGELDSRYAVLFDGMKVERVEGRTVLTGPVLDQSQLHGFTRCLFELGLELLSLELCDPT